MTSFGDKARRGNFRLDEGHRRFAPHQLSRRSEDAFWRQITDAHADDETALIGKVDDRAILREMHRVV
jgi:hypothetical protein